MSLIGRFGTVRYPKRAWFEWREWCWIETVTKYLGVGLILLSGARPDDHFFSLCMLKTIASFICSGSLRSSFIYWLGRLPLVFGPINRLMVSPISLKYKNMALMRLLSNLDPFVSLPFLYWGWFAPCGDFLDSCAPCILHALHPYAAGFWQRSLVLFDRTSHCLAPFITLGRGICKVLYKYLQRN